MSETESCRAATVTATVNGSPMHNGSTIALSASPLKHVSFKPSINAVPLPLEEISASKSDKVKRAPRNSSIVSLSELRLSHYKLAVIFGICFIVALFMLPVVFYYLNGGTKFDELLPMNINDIETVNTSQSTFCDNFTIPSCSNDLPYIYTYEALRLVSQRTSPHCIDQVNKMLANQSCKDISCVEVIMCQEVRQEYCTAEWRLLELNESERLIDCSDYGETALLNCSDQFDLDNNGSTCRLLCEKFSQFSKTFTSFFPPWLAVFSGLNVIGGTISVAVSIYRIKKLFHYPQILLVMNSFLISILSLFILITTFPLENWKPLCSGRFVLDALFKPNVFCEVQGFIIFAITSLYCYFWFLYTLHLFLRVANPIRMIKLEQLKYSKMIHVIEVTTAVLLGTVPYIIFATNSKFHITTFPPLYCGTDPVYNFYGTIVPTVVVSCATLIMMLFVLYKIHVHKGIFRRSDGYSKLCCIKFSISEVKIFLTFCYLLIVMVLLWTSNSIDSARFDETVSTIRTYAECMSGGIRKGLDCEHYRKQIEARTYPPLLIAYFTLFSFLSYSNLPFLIKLKTIKLFVVNTAKKLSYKRSTSSASTSA